MDKDNQKYNKFSDRRKFARIPVNSKVNYFLIVKSIKKMGKGNGTVVNISQSGMMLQTDHKITSNYIYLVYKDSDDKKIGMIGKIVFSKLYRNGLYRNGIKFQAEHKDNVEFRKSIIHEFHMENVIGKIIESEIENIGRGNATYKDSRISKGKFKDLNSVDISIKFKKRTKNG